MILLVLAMAWSRRGQTLMVALLAMFGVAASVAAPAYLRAADRAVAAGQIATASSSERTIEVSSVQADFTSAGAALVDLPKFSYVYAEEYATIGIEPDNAFRTRLVQRQQVCEHLTMVSGRCLTGEADIVLGKATSDRLTLHAGDSITLSYAVFNDDPDRQVYQAQGAPKQLFVAGIYTVPDAADAYWGTHGYFATDSGGEPAFVGAPTVAAMEHDDSTLSIDGVAGPGALDVDRLPALRDGLAALQRTVTAMGPQITLKTDMPNLLNRIDAGRREAHAIVPVLAVPLILLACLTIFLAVRTGMDERRPELAVVALRGARRAQRWWLATGDSLVAIVAGAVVGCFTGQLLVNALAAWRFPGVGADPGLASLKYAPIATLAAALTTIVAVQRQVRTPVAALIRQATAASGRAGTIVLDVALTGLAIAAGLQLTTSLDGVGTFAPALIILALARLTAWALIPAAAAFSAASLRRGSLGAALAGFHVSRRPGAARLFALLTAATAIIGYVVCANGTGYRSISAEANVVTGADRVISVTDVTRHQLLDAVQKVDPAGTYAMAAMRFPDAPALAVDTTRLAAVTGSSLAELHPVAPAPLILHGTELAFDITAAGFPSGKSPRLSITLDDTVVPVGSMNPGRHRYVERVSACADGCRLSVLTIVGSYGALDASGVLTFRIPGASAWRASSGGAVSVTPDGVRVDVQGLAGLPEGVMVRPVDAPYPLPIAVAGTGLNDPSLTGSALTGSASAGLSLTGLDGNPISVVPAVSLPAVPGLGGSGALVDLVYADRLAVDPDTAHPAQVWLSRSAPSDVVQRLRAAGLVVAADMRQSEVRNQLAHEGPAVALEFALLAGVLALALAAGALVLGSSVARADLVSLRMQGLSGSAVRIVMLWTYPLLVLMSVLAGTGIALLAWQLTGWALPLSSTDLALPHWPGAESVVVAALVVWLALTGVALRVIVLRRRDG